MSLFVPAALEKQLLEFGDEGTQWHNRLPERIAELEQRWHFRTGSAFDHGGTVSWVAPVTLQDGSEAVLKMGFPHDEARFEADALRFLDGEPAARLLQVSEDGFSLLLERCLPGTDLWTLEEAEGDGVACDLLPRLWREPEPNAPFLSLTDYVAHWWEEMPQTPAEAGYAPELIAQAVTRGQELVATQPQRVFLHGDFHPGNVLAAQREPWLVIDPKPLVGEPAYDIAQWLYNRSAAAMQSGDPVAVLRDQIDRFAATLALDPARIAGWAFVKALGWECGPHVVTLFHEVAKVWQERRGIATRRAAAGL